MVVLIVVTLLGQYSLNVNFRHLEHQGYSNTNSLLNLCACINEFSLLQWKSKVQTNS